jgi:hypothetical protein
MVQPPVSPQSKSHVAPSLQMVVQLPAGALQSVEQLVLGAHSVLQAPPGHSSLHGWSVELQVKLHTLGLSGSPLSAHEQVAPEHEHCALGVVGSAVQPTPAVPEPPWPEVVPPLPVVVEEPAVPPWPVVVPPLPVVVEDPAVPPRPVVAPPLPVVVEDPAVPPWPVVAPPLPVVVEDPAEPPWPEVVPPLPVVVEDPAVPPWPVMVEEPAAPPVATVPPAAPPAEPPVPRGATSSPPTLPPSPAPIGMLASFLAGRGSVFPQPASRVASIPHVTSTGVAIRIEDLLGD